MHRGGVRKVFSVGALVGLVGLSVVLGGARVSAKDPLPDQYSLTIHYPDGRMNTLTGVESHQLVSEKGVTFLSVILKDGRRFLLSVEDREFEFSSELGQIIQSNVEVEE